MAKGPCSITILLRFLNAVIPVIHWSSMDYGAMCKIDSQADRKKRLTLWFFLWDGLMVCSWASDLSVTARPLNNSIDLDQCPSGWQKTPILRRGDGSRPVMHRSFPETFLQWGYRKRTVVFKEYVLDIGLGAAVPLRYCSLPSREPKVSGGQHAQRDTGKLLDH